MAQSPARPLRRPAACLLLLLAAASPSSGQAADPKAPFLQALGRFSAALDGAVGDEGRIVRSSLEAMTRGLQEWDATLQVSEQALAGELPRATPALAGRMHLAIGAAYLDRYRSTDALRELESAIRLDPSQPDAFTFEGLARSQLTNDLEHATIAFRQAAALDPRSPVRAYVLARSLSRGGRTAEAAQAFQTVLRSWREGTEQHPDAALDMPFIRLGLVQERSGVEPYFPPVLYAEGFALLQRGEFAKALDAFGRAAARDALVANAVEPREAMGLAAAAFRDGDTDAAVRHLNVAIELEPNRADAHRLLGRVLLSDRRDDEAVRELEAAVRLGPGDERTYLALSDALQELQRLPDAERVLHDAIQAFPSSGRAHYKLARLYQRQNKSVDALSELQAAARLNPLIGLNRVLQAIGALHVAQQNFEAAVEAYSARVDVHPNDAEAHQALGLTYSRLERADEALAEFAIALLLHPGWSNIYVGMSQLYLRQGDFGGAADAARQAVTRDPSDRQAHYALATALTRLGRPDDARAELDVYERLQRDETAAFVRQMTLNGLRREASVRSDNRENERAVALLRKVLELEPAAAASHLELGLALLKAGQPAEAVEQLEAAQRLQDSVEVHRHLSDAYAALGRTDDSLRERAAYEQRRRESRRRATADR